MTYTCAGEERLLSEDITSDGPTAEVASPEVRALMAAAVKGPLLPAQQQQVHR